MSVRLSAYFVPLPAFMFIRLSAFHASPGFHVHTSVYFLRLPFVSWLIPDLYLISS